MNFAVKLCVGVILAGGRSQRMGVPHKCLLELGGKTLLTRVRERFEGQVGGLALNVNGDIRPFARMDLPILSDSIPGYPGPLAGVLAGLDWAHAIGATHVVSVAADTPFLPLDLVARLERARTKTATPIALAATHEGGICTRHPTFGLWSVDLRADLRASLNEGVRKVVLWTDKHGASSAAFDDHAFFNINTPEDLSKAQQLL